MSYLYLVEPFRSDVEPTEEEIVAGAIEWFEDLKSSVIEGDKESAVQAIEIAIRKLRNGHDRT